MNTVDYMKTDCCIVSAQLLCDMENQNQVETMKVQLSQKLCPIIKDRVKNNKLSYHIYVADLGSFYMALEVFNVLEDIKDDHIKRKTKLSKNLSTDLAIEFVFNDISTQYEIINSKAFGDYYNRLKQTTINVHYHTVNNNGDTLNKNKYTSNLVDYITSCSDYVIYLNYKNEEQEDKYTSQEVKDIIKCMGGNLHIVEILNLD